MPGRPTREFWNKVYPAVLARGFSPKRAAKITAAEWYHHLKKLTKLKYERVRRKRERKRK